MFVYNVLLGKKSPSLSHGVCILHCNARGKVKALVTVCVCVHYNVGKKSQSLSHSVCICTRTLYCLERGSEPQSHCEAAMFGEGFKAIVTVSVCTVMLGEKVKALVAVCVCMHCNVGEKSQSPSHSVCLYAL